MPPKKQNKKPNASKPKPPPKQEDQYAKDLKELKKLQEKNKNLFRIIQDLNSILSSKARANSELIVYNQIQENHRDALTMIMIARQIEAERSIANGSIEPQNQN